MVKTDPLNITETFSR